MRQQHTARLVVGSGGSILHQLMWSTCGVAAPHARCRCPVGYGHECTVCSLQPNRHLACACATTGGCCCALVHQRVVAHLPSVWGIYVTCRGTTRGLAAVTGLWIRHHFSAIYLRHWLAKPSQGRCLLSIPLLARALGTCRSTYAAHPCTVLHTLVFGCRPVAGRRAAVPHHCNLLYCDLPLL